MLIISSVIYQDIMPSLQVRNYSFKT